MQAESFLDRIGPETELLTRAATWAGLEAKVPSCPGWTVRRLVQHTTKVHHSTLALLRGGDHATFSFDLPPDEDLFEILTSGAAQLEWALRAATDDLAVWTFLPTSVPRLFWARRQAHETAMHRVDAELAAACGVTEFDPGFAADGLDELLISFVASRFRGVGVPRPFTLGVTPLDVNAGWTVSAGAGGVSSVREVRDGCDLMVFGMASDLYRWAWNRAGDDEVSLRGDMTIADLWRSTFRVGARQPSA
ncbi:maleylpyruvate isomerase family mycothiol-dependent enzyme [Jatrophihabitans telluris]|uniref:Maleylpyruvate isomerase family mycothiol-dependent enzyme n=1 Tax=Jatrophihabitans telluris TaxID=2038343 RepID=A0ABY4QYV9_9ACTN|nr:maleylpyruvate isomerase family mycothiol-dependent enzyme [Jatrophihabitans telluris]UQX88513.1 maleylpyruvate isomerase family mycothiol-dependent enzyme [Jatrophihabitans telluris]